MKAQFKGRVGWQIAEGVYPHANPGDWIIEELETDNPRYLTFAPYLAEDILTCELGHDDLLDGQEGEEREQSAVAYADSFADDPIHGRFEVDEDYWRECPRMNS